MVEKPAESLRPQGKPAKPAAKKPPVELPDLDQASIFVLPESARKVAAVPGKPPLPAAFSPLPFCPLPDSRAVLQGWKGFL